MEWVSFGVVGVLINFLLVSAGNKEYVKYNSLHLDAALHHYDTLHVDQISHSHSAEDGIHHRHVTFNALGQWFHMDLQWDRHILTEDFAVYAVDAKGNRNRHHIDKKAFLHGHLKNETESLVTAHLSSEGVLSAVITTSNDIYHVEPSYHYIREPHPFHMVAYARSQVKQRLNATQFDFVVPSVSDYQQQGPGAISKHHTILSNTGMGHRTTSPRLLRRQTIDGGRENSCNMILIADLSALRLFMDVQSASSQLVLLISSVDKMIYRPTRWLVNVNDETITDRGHSIQTILVHTAASTNPLNYTRDDPGLEAGDILGLMRFGPWQTYCLAHLFTNRNFPSGLLGLANIASPQQSQTGGICSEEFSDFSVSPSRSIIFNTGLSTYNNNGQQMILFEMIRVVGHELGHNWGSHHDPPRCGNGFLMNEFAQDGSSLSHMTFSECSRRSIGEVLLSKSSCFQAPQTVCGDYQVNGNEACDVGPDGDSCCTSLCTLTDGSQCSDRNSLCCRDCLIANTSTVCQRGPRVSANCTANTFCNGVNVTCPSTPEPAANGTQCRNGICLLANDSESETMCFPLCTVMGLTNCTCPPEDECRVCCVGEDRLCSPLPEVSLSDSSPCQQGVCIDGMCSSQTQDVITRFWTIIITLNTSAFRQLIDENIVGFTLIFSIPIWCLGSCLLHWLVDHPRILKFEASLKRDKVDLGQVFVKKSKKVPESDSMKKPLLAEGEQPVDNLPPPPRYNSS